MVVSMFCRHNISMVNLLKGKGSQTNYTERSPLLCFAHEER